MAKALELNSDALATFQPVPKAAKPATPGTSTTRSKPLPEAKRAPLQVRWPAKDLKAAKMAAIQLEFPTGKETLSPDGPTGRSHDHRRIAVPLPPRAAAERQHQANNLPTR